MDRFQGQKKGNENRRIVIRSSIKRCILSDTLGEVTEKKCTNKGDAGEESLFD